MALVHLLQPDLVLGDTILTLTPDILRKHGIKGLILDVDDTIVPIRNTTPDQALVDWITSVRKVASIWLVSNNLSNNRIGSIASNLDLPYLLGAGKPSGKKLVQALTAMQLNPQEVAMVGDRLFTDIVAGNRLNMFSILVEPIVSSQSHQTFHLIRQTEFWISRRLGVSLLSSPPTPRPPLGEGS
jgi:hypothetical protein